MNRSGQVLKGVAALAALGGLVVGVPLLLVAVAGWPLPAQLPAAHDDRGCTHPRRRAGDHRRESGRGRDLGGVGTAHAEREHRDRRGSCATAGWGGCRASAPAARWPHRLSPRRRRCPACLARSDRSARFAPWVPWWRPARCPRPSAGEPPPISRPTRPGSARGRSGLATRSGASPRQPSAGVSGGGRSSG